ncbi:MAG: 3-deoxy-manno-octulosonate cytidylyltransferase [Bacteroidetes bacterium]|nr:3-deoxy-manno-octulosonate cytidylyltransferase [Bacteroidota bacterium]
MKKIAMIPARYAATRFPYKLMHVLGNKTVIRHTYDNTVATGLFDDVIVVTDHQNIFKEINNHGGKAVMSQHTHESGSDRIAEAAAAMDVDIILNVQGDEPFVKKEPLQKLLQAFDDEKVQVASLMKKFTNTDLIKNPNYVKVVVDIFNDALYFSRSVIPYQRDENVRIDYFEHIGVYAFRKKALLDFTNWPATQNEQAEKLEQLRYLCNGVKIRMVETTETTVKIDVPEDIIAAEKYLDEYKN